MKKINLRNDYCSIAHDEILKALLNANNNTYVGYGLDEECEQASNLIKKQLNNENVDVFFLSGGTITNKVFISHILKPYEAVISPDTGHINTHETGTIEQSGHKVISVPNVNGKIKCEDIKNICLNHTDEHMVKPKMVYISNPTEFGTIYTKKELEEISNICKQYELYLYVDGARLATALTSKNNDLTLESMSKLVDGFYIGGTKNGLVLGEALVIMNKELSKEIRYSIKHFGGMYCKSFVTGIEFKALFTNDLFFKIGELENNQAIKLYNGLKEIGVEFLYPQDTNQIFPIFENDIIEKLRNFLMFEMWEQGNKKSIIRFVTHYKLTDEHINYTIEIVKKLLSKEI